MEPRIGTAGWGIPGAVADAFPGPGSVLERYTRVLTAAEINSTFYRSHRPSTFERWARSVPTTFRFSVKVPRSITHEARLARCEAKVDAFLTDIAPLGERLGPLLLQLPPSLAFDPDLTGVVCARLTRGEGVEICCEPRHPTWFTADADAWLAQRRIARVAAHPSPHPGAEEPGGWRGIAYYRLHGAPRVYFSRYDAEALAALAARLTREPAPDVLCVFDNTGSGAAAADALALKGMLAAVAAAEPGV
ncbi:MAG: hypothetical protein JWO83_2625 [Caulobacteraceae bacterium]|nr:hypothetical protein [Caulobacteraceae bacterium]